MKLENLLTTRGRINRTEFLFRYSIYLLVAILLLVAANLLPERVRPAIELMLHILFWILVFVLTVQRVHDYDEPAWYALLILVPVVNIFVIFTPGIIAPNKYGDPPPSPSGKKQLLTAIVLILPFLLIFLSPVGHAGVSLRDTPADTENVR